MTIIDYVIFALYMCGVLSIGIYHFRRNESAEDYYIGSRKIKAHHVGISIVATDVGGGFSIGLGGLGFAMGLSGSWLLFTGLVGAWLAAVLIIPKVKRVDRREDMYTYPDFLRHRFGNNVALLAALISGIGYLGFTGGQILAGATLASATLFETAPMGWDPVRFSLFAIAGITIVYTVVGGLKAVIYTDTIQWMILLGGLILVTVPWTIYAIGGLGVLRAELPPEFFSLRNIEPAEFLNWMVTIIPIWLIGMTLYQRMYACKDTREAKKAWFIAGIFEYPIMAFTGAFLGMCARIMFPEASPEAAMPMLIQDVLPPVITGIVIAAYFSAIMSTADSCLMASSGNFLNDVIQRYFLPDISEKSLMRWSQAITLVIGILAVLLASYFRTVLDAILYAYGFMVSGLCVPTLGAYFWRRSSSTGAFAGMLTGGVYYLIAEISGRTLLVHPERLENLGLFGVKFLELDATLYGIILSAVAFLVGSFLKPDAVLYEPAPATPTEQAG